MNLANRLTMSRFFMAGAVLVLLSVQARFAVSAAFVLFVLACLTDALDGHLARKVYGCSDFGRLMDPLADKVLVCAVLVRLVGYELSAVSGGLLPAWMVVVILSREFLVTGLRTLAADKGRVLAANQWGKIKTVFQMVALVAVLLVLALRADWLAADAAAKLDPWVESGARWLFGLVTLLTAISGGIYFREHRDLLATR